MWRNEPLVGGAAGGSVTGGVLDGAASLFKKSKCPSPPVVSEAAARLSLAAGCRDEALAKKKKSLILFYFIFSVIEFMDFSVYFLIHHLFFYN